MSRRPDLLRPTVSEPAQLAAAPYTLQAGFLTAFFGGPLAAAAMLGVNAWRLRRLPRDAGWIALIAVGFVAWLAFMHRTEAGQALHLQMVDAVGRNAMSLAARLFALVACLGGAWLHRREQRSADLFGLERPRGLGLGVLLILLGWGASHLLGLALSEPR